VRRRSPTSKTCTGGGGPSSPSPVPGARWRADLTGGAVRKPAGRSIPPLAVPRHRTAASRSGALDPVCTTSGPREDAKRPEGPAPAGALWEQAPGVHMFWVRLAGEGLGRRAWTPLMPEDGRGRATAPVQPRSADPARRLGPAAGRRPPSRGIGANPLHRPHDAEGARDVGTDDGKGHRPPRTKRWQRGVGLT